MADMTFRDIPQEDRSRIKQRLIEQLDAMDDAELETYAQTRESLADYIAEAIAGLAALFGYVIALPIAWGVLIAESIWDGLKSGWEAGINSTRRRRARRK